MYFIILHVMKMLRDVPLFVQRLQVFTQVHSFHQCAIFNFKNFTHKGPCWSFYFCRFTTAIENYVACCKYVMAILLCKLKDSLLC